jgi:hypothetical protein
LYRLILGLMICITTPAANQSVGTAGIVQTPAFTLRDDPSETAPLGLPRAFSNTAPDDRTTEEAWEITALKASPLSVSVAHPKGWKVGSVPDTVFVAVPPDSSFSLAMMQPIETKVEPLKPVTNGRLKEAAATIADGYQRPIAAMGQARVADRLWLWFDLGVSDAPPAGSPTTAYQWVFTSVVENHQVILALTVRIDRNETEEREAQIRRAGPTFARVLEGTSFARTP